MGRSNSTSKSRSLVGVCSPWRMTQTRQCEPHRNAGAATRCAGVTFPLSLRASSWLAVCPAENRDDRRSQAPLQTTYQERIFLPHASTVSFGFPPETPNALHLPFGEHPTAPARMGAVPLRSPSPDTCDAPAQNSTTVPTNSVVWALDALEPFGKTACVDQSRRISYRIMRSS